MIYKAEDGIVCSTREKLCMKKFRQALQREASALRRSCLTTIATNMLASILITAVISNGFLAAASPFVPAKPQHPTGKVCFSAGSQCCPAVCLSRIPVYCHECNG